MQPITRRTAIAGAASTAITATAFAADAAQQQKQASEPLSPDQQFVVEAGMTAEEANCWKLTAEAAGAFFALPELHPMDKHEVASAIHILQNKLLGRPTYRKYLELAKAAAGAKAKKEEQ